MIARAWRGLSAALTKLAIGAFGDCKTIGANLFELRMFFGPGYRVYYTIKNREIIFLLAWQVATSPPKLPISKRPLRSCNNWRNRPCR